MVEENIIREFRLKHTDKTRNYFLEEIYQNELMSKKHKKICTIILNTFIYQLLQLLDVFFSDVTSLIGIRIGMTGFAIGFVQICAITPGIKKI